MNIVFISKYALNPELGNTTRQFHYCNHLAQKKGNSVLLVSSRSAFINKPKKIKGRKKEYKYGNLRHFVLNGCKIKPGFSLKRIWSWIWFELQILRIRGEIREFKPDVIVVSSLSILTFLSGVFLKAKLSKPLVLEVRDIYPETLKAIAGLKDHNPIMLFLSWVEKFGYRNADAIISGLPNCNLRVRERIGKPPPFEYFPTGYEPRDFEIAAPRKTKQEILDRVDQIEADFLVCYFGSLGKANAMHTPLSAFRNTAQSHPNVHLVVFGEGPLKPKYVDEFDNVNTIHFFDFVPRCFLPEIAKKADLLINPWLDRPIYKYGISPNKWIDYMVAGKPILCSFSGYQNLLTERDIGWFIPPENEVIFSKWIIKIASMPEDKLRRMGDNGNQYLRSELNYQTLGEKLHAYLKKIIEEASAKAVN